MSRFSALPSCQGMEELGEGWAVVGLSSWASHPSMGPPSWTTSWDHLHLFLCFDSWDRETSALGLGVVISGVGVGERKTLASGVVPDGPRLQADTDNHHLSTLWKK